MHTARWLIIQIQDLLNKGVGTQDMSRLLDTPRPRIWQLIRDHDLEPESDEEVHK